MTRRARRGGWSWLLAAEGEGNRSNELAECFASCFSTPAGRRVLEYLRRAFLSRRVPPTAPDAVLRHVEGQRSVVAHIHSLVEQGLAARRN